jgi:hypothetical protein
MEYVENVFCYEIAVICGEKALMSSSLSYDV